MLIVGKKAVEQVAVPNLSHGRFCKKVSASSSGDREGSWFTG
jgi:hypothetical protein